MSNFNPNKQGRAVKLNGTILSRLESIKSVEGYSVTIGRLIDAAEMSAKEKGFL